MRVDARLGGPSGAHELHIRISDAGGQAFESTRTIYFVDDKARLTITPIVQGDVRDEGELLLTIDGEALPAIPLIVRDRPDPAPSPATRVLVIADGSVDNSIIQRVLLDLLCDYDVAIDSAAGVRALESPPGYDLVITSVPEFVDQVRALPGHRSTYVILASPDGPQVTSPTTSLSGRFVKTG